MKRFWDRNEFSDIEDGLRAARPVPREDFVASVSGRIERSRVTGRPRALRYAFAGGLTAALLVSMAAFGGFGYAASSARHAAGAVRHAVAPHKSKPTTRLVTAARSEYAGVKCLVQHKTGNGGFVTIFVNPNAVPAHKAHGDTVIICPAP